MKKINKIDKTLARLIKRKEKTQLAITVTKHGISLKTCRRQKDNKEYWEQFYPPKFDNLDEIWQFLKKHKPQN